MKKTYMKPSTIEVKLETGHLLSVSDNKVYGEMSTNASYSRGGDSSFFDDDEE